MPSLYMVKSLAPVRTLTGVAIASMGPAANGALGGSSNGISQTFQAAGAMVIQQVKCSFWTTPPAGTYRFGIVNNVAMGQQPGTNPNFWLGGPTNFVDVVNPGSGDLLITLPADVVLPAGGQASFVAYALTSGSISAIAYNFTTAVGSNCSCPSGINYGTDFNFNTTVLEVPFTLYGT